uniref:Uncharacterized protein n=1 Tax=Chromera velia CCMP2878 TaxID=1169474 RepID=A0A0G4IDF2_9ALVE|eukprot:Cvel_13351.t1-p1 / transcript=Cvel_13351.t1 / gene=Cvel_13351 / organism=Chromera_velia_CCMP2878 / gene_product=hypothetical protein / transcript_product=hypothetical protein / location=Cvel_scaffold907:12611-13234(-) / protein_length=208 / sequence_SO=supercontig / SO=protein_coding / is_pseudo=false
MPRVNAKQMSRRRQREARAIARGPGPLRDILLQMHESFRPDRELRPRKEEAIAKLLRMSPLDAVALKVRAEMLLKDLEGAVKSLEGKEHTFEHRKLRAWKVQEEHKVTDDERETLTRLQSEAPAAVQEFVQNHRRLDPEYSALLEWRAALGCRDPVKVPETGRRLLDMFRTDKQKSWDHRLRLLMAIIELRCIFWSASSNSSGRRISL